MIVIPNFESSIPIQSDTGRLLADFRHFQFFCELSVQRLSSCLKPFELSSGRPLAHSSKAFKHELNLSTESSQKNWKCRKSAKSPPVVNLGSHSEFRIFGKLAKCNCAVGNSFPVDSVRLRCELCSWQLLSRRFRASALWKLTWIFTRFTAQYTVPKWTPSFSDVLPAPSSDRRTFPFSVSHPTVFPNRTPSVTGSQRAPMRRGLLTSCLASLARDPGPYRSS